MADEDRITGFEFVGATPLTEEQYSTSFVNFYNQFLGLPTLEEETGVEVETSDDITELREMAPAERGEASERSVLGPGGTIGYQDISIYDGSSMSSFGSYKEALQAAGLNDRVPFVENIVDPIMSGNVMGIEFGKQAGVVAEQKAAEFKEVVSTAGIKQKVAKVAPKAMAGVTSMVAPGLFGAGIGGLLTGSSFVNAFGKPSFRPGGILGAVTDFVATMQYNDMAAINAAIASKAPVPTGFAMSIGNTGITRAPGSGTYTGNMQGMTHKQVKAMEALAKGFVPTGYNLQQETGTSLREAGYNTGQLSTGGYYKEDGTYMDGFGNTSAMGLEKDLNALADKYGITPDQASNALSNARQGNGTLSGNLAAAAAGQQRAAEVQRQPDADKQRAADLDRAQAAAEQRQREAEAQRQADAAAREYAGGNRRGEFDTGDRPDRSSPDRASVGSFSRGDFGGSRGFVGGFAQGGPIGLQAGGMAGQSGFVQQPPSQVSEGQTVADNVETQLPEGAFVINAAAVEFAGESDIRKMLVDAQKEAVRRGLTSGENGARINRYIDVAISRGEVVVSPHLAKIIGYDRLEKINNRGKRETQQRIEENGQEQPGMAEGGGFLMPEPRPRRPRLEGLADVELRADLEEYIQNDPLARLGFHLYEKGDVDVKAIVLPSDYDEDLYYGGIYTPVESREAFSGREHVFPKASEMEGFVEQQQGPDKEDRSVASIHYYVGNAKNYDRYMNNLTLLHELRHHAFRHLEKTYGIPLPRTTNIEEHLQDIQDYMNRIDARKVKPSIPEKSKSPSKQARGRQAFVYSDKKGTLAAYQKAAEDALKDRKVPERVKSKEVEGFLDKAMDFLGLK